MLKAMPTCVLVKSPQAFVIPVSGQFDLRKPAEYLEPLGLLCCSAKELIAILYGTKYQIQAAAIVEDSKKEKEKEKEKGKEKEWHEWWLVLSLDPTEESVQLQELP